MRKLEELEVSLPCLDPLHPDFGRSLFGAGVALGRSAGLAWHLLRMMIGGAQNGGLGKLPQIHGLVTE
jgi:hypothetical protein